MTTFIPAYAAVLELALFDFTTVNRINDTMLGATCSRKYGIEYCMELGRPTGYTPDTK